MYQLVNMLTCEIIDPTSPNSAFGFFFGRSRMNAYLGHLDVLSRLLRCRNIKSMGSRDLVFSACCFEVSVGIAVNFVR